MRSSLSAEEAQNQKLYLGAEIGFYFINSCILGAYYMKSYKKCGPYIRTMTWLHLNMCERFENDEPSENETEKKVRNS